MHSTESAKRNEQKGDLRREDRIRSDFERVTLPESRGIDPKNFEGILKEIHLHKAESKKILEVQERKSTIFEGMRFADI